MISTNEDNNGKIYKIDVTDDTTCEIYRKGKIVYSDRYGSIIDAQKLYNKVMSAQENEREIVMLFGRTACEILEALDFHEKGKTVMTREEAIRIVRAGIFGLTDTGQSHKWVDTLEALGLITFDEPKRKYIFFPHPDEGKDNVSVYQDDAIKTLKKYGYTIHDKHGIKL